MKKLIIVSLLTASSFSSIAGETEKPTITELYESRTASVSLVEFNDGTVKCYKRTSDYMVSEINEYDETYNNGKRLIGFSGPALSNLDEAEGVTVTFESGSVFNAKHTGNMWLLTTEQVEATAEWSDHQREFTIEQGLKTVFTGVRIDKNASSTYVKCIDHITGEK